MSQARFELGPFRMKVRSVTTWANLLGLSLRVSTFDVYQKSTVLKIFCFMWYRWDCYKSVSSMYRAWDTFSSNLLRTGQNAHASTESGWIIPRWQGPTPCAGLSEHSWNHSNSEGLYCLIHSAHKVKSINYSLNKVFRRYSNTQASHQSMVYLLCKVSWLCA